MRSRGARWLPVLAMVASMAVAAATPAEYAMQWPLSLAREDGGAFRVVLDAGVYRQLRDPGLRDLVVLDREGVPVASALFAPEDGVAEAARQVAVPWFALPATAAGNASQGWALVSEADADGRLRRVEVRVTDRAAAAMPRTALLLDLSRVREPVVALQLQWQPVSALDLGYRVEASDDLEQWQAVATRGRLIDLQRDGRRLLHRRIELFGLLPHRQRARYLRLTPDPGGQALAITGISAELVAAPAVSGPAWLQLDGTRRGAGRGTSFEFELDGRFPVLQADVALAGNHAVEWRLESRDDADAPWRLRAGPWMAYRVDAAGAGSRSPAQALAGVVRDRHWRLRADAEVAGTPQLRLGYRPEAVVFLAQGSGPYALAAGSARARRAPAPMSRLLAELRRQHGREWQPAPAYLGTPRPLAGASALEPARDWTHWLLWAVLGLGALVVAGFALSLLRRPPGSP